MGGGFRRHLVFELAHPNCCALLIRVEGLSWTSASKDVIHVWYRGYIPYTMLLPSNPGTNPVQIKEASGLIGEPGVSNELFHSPGIPGTRKHFMQRFDL